MLPSSVQLRLQGAAPSGQLNGFSSLVPKFAGSFMSYCKITHKALDEKIIQSNFNGSNTFGTMKISSRQG